MDTHQLKCFLAVAETLHFGRAAQSLDVLPASLGRQIRLLEDRLETRLFLRTTRSVTLTEAGQSILEDARACRAGRSIFRTRLKPCGAPNPRP